MYFTFWVSYINFLFTSKCLQEICFRPGQFDFSTLDVMLPATSCPSSQVDTCRASVGKIGRHHQVLCRIRVSVASCFQVAKTCSLRFPPLQPCLPLVQYRLKDTDTPAARTKAARDRNCAFLLQTAPLMGTRFCLPWSL